MSFLIDIEELQTKPKRKKIKAAKNCKSKCCDKFKKGKRCKRCPLFDLLKKAS
jgi:hypothetical protein